MTFPDPGARLQRFVWGSFRQTVTVNRLNGFSFDTEVLYQGIHFRIVANLFKPTFILFFKGWGKEVGPQDLTEEEKRKLEKEYPNLPWRTVKIPTSPKPPKQKK